MQHSIPVSHSKVEFRGLQKRKGKLVLSKSRVFHVWHIVSSIAQGQNVVNVHKLACCWPRYEIYLIKSSVSPEIRKIDFLKHFPRAKSVP